MQRLQGVAPHLVSLSAAKDKHAAKRGMRTSSLRVLRAKGRG